MPAKISGAVTGSVTLSALDYGVEVNSILPSLSGTIANELLWTTSITDITAVSNNGYLLDTSSVAITITLPVAPLVGDIIRIVDWKGTSNSRNITVRPNGMKFEGLTSNYIITTNNLGLLIVYGDAAYGWVIANQ